jgi:hypothetical protein
MKEKPILYSPPMVRSTIRGIKTNTRRVMKDVYENGDWSIQKAKEPRFHGHTHDWYLNGAPNPHAGIKCPYGQVGDQLWVRESFYRSGISIRRSPESEEFDFCARSKNLKDLSYAADGKPDIRGLNSWGISPGSAGDRQFIPDSGSHYWRKMPSIHMPRWASRIQMEITDIRIEKLQDISDDDALAEGIVEVHGIVDVNCNGGSHNEVMGYRYFYDGCGIPFEDPVEAFKHLWESINGTGSWDLNPLVWVIEFKVIKGLSK